MNRSSLATSPRIIAFILVLHLFAAIGFSGTVPPKRRHRRVSAAHKTTVVRRPAQATVKPAAALASRTTVRVTTVQKLAVAGPRPVVPAAPIIAGGPWTSPTYADSTDGDNIDGEDMDIRRAAVDALGQYNGSVVVVDPNTGRILSMVNQKVALSSGFQPCSTVKVSVALAGLSEKIIQPATKYRLGGMRMDLTYALAHSNNYYFATLGEKLGYDRVAYYARLFGYGEKAGLNIPGEQPGHYPAAAPKNGGVGMLTSFGEEIQQTPLQLAALMSAIANGGTLNYLQYPRTQAEVQSLRAAGEAAAGYRERHPDGEAGDARRGGVRHGAPRARRRRNCGQDRNLQRESHAPGMVRVIQRCRRPEAGGGGAADGRTSGDRSAGGGHRGRCVPQARREKLFPRRASHDTGNPGVQPDLLLPIGAHRIGQAACYRGERAKTPKSFLRFP